MSVTDLTGLLCALQDSVMVLSPRGWTFVELEVVEAGGGLKLAGLSAKGEGAKAPRPMPRLNIESREEAQRLSDALTELSSQVGKLGKTWAGGTVEVRRSPEGAEWRLKNPAGAVRWLGRLSAEDLEALFFTDVLFDALLGTERAFEDLQASVDLKLASVRTVHVDEGKGVLQVGAFEAPSLRLGSYDALGFQWTWDFDGPTPHLEARERLHRICHPDEGALGLAVFARRQFFADEGFAWALCSHVCVAMGGKGLVRVPRDAHEATVDVYAFLAPPQVS